MKKPSSKSPRATRKETKGQPESALIVLSRDEQVALWQALHEPAKLTAAQRKLSAIMRGH